MAPTKNMDRNEWFAEKATEIGFDELTFLNCRFSERKVIKAERIEKILISAIKQSLKARLPKLNEMSDKWLAAVKDNGMKWIQVSDLNAFDNPAAKDYAVQGIPSNFLIDASGNIVAKNLRGEDLYKKVEELLGK